ncbi:MAG: hypothetical protein AB7N61_09255 [Acidimicrobiia bacterium]
MGVQAVVIENGDSSVVTTLAASRSTVFDANGWLGSGILLLVLGVGLVGGASMNRWTYGNNPGAMRVARTMMKVGCVLAALACVLLVIGSLVELFS